MQNQLVSATVITGFLGAGKTTLIRNIIENANGKRLALIVNEFGDVGIDGMMLDDCGSDACRADDIIELANGCICCTVADDFLPSMQALLEQTPPPDHIIETSGLALPQPLVQAFNWPDIKTRAALTALSHWLMVPLSHKAMLLAMKQPLKPSAKLMRNWTMKARLMSCLKIKSVLQI